MKNINIFHRSKNIVIRSGSIWLLTIKTHLFEHASVKISGLIIQIFPSVFFIIYALIFQSLQYYSWFMITRIYHEHKWRPFWSLNFIRSLYSLVFSTINDSHTFVMVSFLKRMISIPKLGRTRPQKLQQLQKLTTPLFVHWALLLVFVPIRQINNVWTKMFA